MLFDAARCCKHGGSELNLNGATGLNLQWLTSFVSLSCVFSALTNHDTERPSFWWEGKLFADQISDLLIKLRRRTIDFHGPKVPNLHFDRVAP